MSCLNAKEMVRQIRREEKFIRDCQVKRDELRYAIRASRKAIKFWRSELRRLKHNNNNQVEAKND